MPPIFRPPYTDDFVCRVHNRAGSHPDEAMCSATLFRSVDEVAPPADVVGDQGAQPTAAAAGRRYRKRPDPPEVKALAVGALMMVSSGDGPEYPVPRDQFFATYEEIEPEPDPRHVEGPLDQVTNATDHATDEVGVDTSEVKA